MRFSVILALIAAVPIELANFFVFPNPIDVGLPENATWFQRAMGTEWVLLHLPGFHLGGGWAVLTAGYLDTAILIFLVTLCLRWIRKHADKESHLVR